MDYKNYINGKWVESKSGKIFSVENPFNQKNQYNQLIIKFSPNLHAL